MAALVQNLGYTYTSADQVLSMSYPNGETLSYSYDAAGRPSSLCSSLGGCYVSGAGYTALDQKDYWTLGNGLAVDWAYNPLTTRLGRLQVGGAFDRSYAYDPSGNVTSIVDNTAAPIATQSYSYDALQRLYSWTSGSTTQSYAYTPNGNLTTKAGVSYGYGAQSASCAVPGLLKVHAVTSVGGASYCYDRNGNLSSGGGRTYTWDAANRIASVSQTSGTESYTYDGDDERVKVVRGATTTVYFNAIWEAVVGGGTKAYYQFDGQMVAMRESSTGLVTYLHTDHLGSVSVATNSAQQATKQEYDPWGALRSGGISQTNLNYTGQRLDGTGLLYYHARMYDPGLGRFVSADSVVPGSASGSMDGVALKPLTVDFHETGFVAQIGQENSQPFWFQMSDEEKRKAGSPWGPANLQALNRYSYVLNNPLRYTDPSGHCIDGITTALCLAVVVAAVIDAATIVIGGYLIYDGAQQLSSPQAAPATDGSAAQPPRPHLEGPARNLPTGGTHPYVPPKQKGNPEVVKLRGGGYLDKDGNVWKRDPSAHGGEHWDVQKLSKNPLCASSSRCTWSIWASTKSAIRGCARRRER